MDAYLGEKFDEISLEAKLGGDMELTIVVSELNVALVSAKQIDRGREDLGKSFP
ncbi:MAG TPA: hypothetical protein VGQ34_09340 [Sphingomicrobium sp.]|nr:hypothetical protein [Sphingomicrobium sp.]